MTDDIKLTLLGTGTPTPSHHRAGSSYLLEVGDRVLLFDCGPACVRRLLEANIDVRRITDLFNALGDRFLIFAGLDDVALESFMLGCTGWISGLVDAFPRQNRMLWDAAMAGHWEKAREIYRWYMPMLRFDSHPKLVQYIKLTCQELGYGHERTRPPRLPLVGEEREHVLRIVRNCVATQPQETAASLRS